MHTLVKRQVIYAWIAMLSVLFSAFAPAIAGAMPARALAGEDMQVCTMAGMTTIVLATTPSGKSAPADHLAKACPFCAIHAGLATALPPTPFAFARVDTASSMAPAFRQLSRPLFAWTTARPRGPPASH